MAMKVYEMYDENYTSGKEYKNIRKAVRAIIQKSGKFFVEECKNPDIIMLPGGGIEDGESNFECIKRECMEECGVVVEPCEELFAIREYYKDTIFYSTYIKCKIIGTCDKKMTEHEKSLEMISLWQSAKAIKNKIEELICIYPEGSELKGMHKREYLAINHIIEHCSSDKSIQK